MAKKRYVGCAGTVGFNLKTRTFFALGCGKWDCAECSVKRANQWAKRAAAGIEQAVSKQETMNFVTLTQPSGIKTAEYAYSVLRDQWSKLRRWFPDAKTMMYLTFVEQHPKRNLIPHLHLLTTCPWTRKEWKQYAPGAGFGYILKVKTVGEGDRRTHIPAGAASWYVSKYVAKGDLSKHGMPKGFRRVRASQNWPYTQSQYDELWDDLVVKSRGVPLTLWLARLEDIGIDEAARQYSNWLNNETEEAQDVLVLPE